MKMKRQIAAREKGTGPRIVRTGFQMLTDNNNDAYELVFCTANQAGNAWFQWFLNGSPDRETSLPCPHHGGRKHDSASVLEAASLNLLDTGESGGVVVNIHDLLVTTAAGENRRFVKAASGAAAVEVE